MIKEINKVQGDTDAFIETTMSISLQSKIIRFYNKKEINNDKHIA